MGYIRKPLPDDMNVHAWSAADVMVLPAEQCGIPIRATIDLRLQRHPISSALSPKTTMARASITSS
ncbi:hypothetical protein [Sphingomonas sp.]|uniref:hypothetical protein n=1 Tax=Sphingomonas sp. TaxID=28214 RepID=UPI003F70A38B